MKISLTTGLIFLISAEASAQIEASLPRFEVASIKLNTSGEGSSSNDANAGEVIFRNYTLRGILQTAFWIDSLSLIAPEWLSGVRFDISAKVPPGSTREQRFQMMQALLVDRFKLAVHREKRSVPGFALVMAKSGLKIQQVENAGGHITNARSGKLQLQRTTMDQLGETLSGQLRQPVVDETGVQGVFTFTLTYAPDHEDNAKSAEDPRPSIFTALQEQLGLKLEARKVPMDVLVVDHMERTPTEN